MKTRLAPLLAAVAAACALLPGCFQKTTPWDPIGGRYDSGNWFGARFALDLPPDWMMMNFVEDGLVATRDGFNLQSVKVRKIKFGDDLPHTKKKVSQGMAPQELAEVLLDAGAVLLRPRPPRHRRRARDDADLVRAAAGVAGADGGARQSSA